MPDEEPTMRSGVVKRHGDLEIEEDLTSRRRLHRVQRVARLVAVAVLTLGVTGLLGVPADAVLHPLILYVFLLAVFSLAGKRSMAEMDTFDMVTLLIISEATQNALVNDSNSLTYAGLVILTLVSCSVFMSWLKARRPHIEQVLQGGPVILVENGRLLRDRMRETLVDEQDILTSARAEQVERIEQIKYAVLETSGQISIIPR